MDDMFAEMLASLRQGQAALDKELHPLLQAQNPDWSMLERLRDVADEYAGRARQLRRMLTEGVTEAESLEEVDQLCKYFDSTANLIAQETGDADKAEAPPTGDRSGPR